MAKIDKLAPKSGRIIGEDGKTYNRVALLGGGTPVSNEVVDITKFAAESGRLIGEDGKIYNEVDLLNGLNNKMDNIEGEVTELSKLKNWLGETTTPITVNSTTNPITISGVSVMAAAGDVTAYDNGVTKDEFIFSEAGTWQVYDDKLDVYTKDETDELLDTKVDKVQGKGLSTNDFTDAYKNKVDGSEALLKDNAAKNLLPITLDRVKKANEGAEGTWSNNVYTENGITFTVNTDDAGRGTGVTVAQTAGAASASLNLVPVDVELVDDEPVFIYDPTYSAGDYIISIGCELPTGVDLSILYNGNTQQQIHEDTTVTLTEGSGLTAWIYIRSNDVESGDPVIFDSFTVRPMLRRAAVTDGAFEVGYRTQKELDADLTEVEDRLDNLSTDYNDLTNKPSINNVTLSGNKTLSDLGIISGSAGVTVLYNNPTPTVNPQTAALSQPYTDFDFIYITWKLLSGSYNPITLVLRPEDIPAYSANDTIPISFGADDGYIKFPTATSVELTQQPSGWSYVLVNVVGVSLGGCVVDSGMSSTSENPVQNKVIKEYVDNLGLSIVNGQLCQTYNL